MKRLKMMMLVVGLVGVLLFSGHTAIGAELTKLQVQMPWMVKVAEFAPYFLGIEKNFYSEEGLQIEILPSSGSAAAAKIVGAGKVPLGFVDAPVLLLARESGAQIIAVAAVLQRNTGAIFYMKGRGIKNLIDLKGKTVLSEFPSFRHPSLLALISNIGLNPEDEEDIKIVDFGGTAGGRVQALLNGQVDATTLNFFSVQDQSRMLKDNPDVGYFLFKDSGVDSISRVIMANEDFLKKNPAIVSKFVRGSAKAWEYALARPQETIRALRKYVPDMTDSQEKLELDSFEASRPFLKSPQTQDKPRGWMSEKDWTRTQDIFLKAGMLKKKEPIGTVFTNKFIQ